MRLVAPALALLLLSLVAGFVTGQPGLNLKVEDVMTPQQMKETGVDGESSQQRQAFNRWLNEYTLHVVGAVRGSSKTSCSPTIESTISGDFSGWDGETVFKLDNGQIWQQAEHSYTYSYSYRPEVTIYQVSGGCRLKVEDEEETIMVRRIK